MKKLFETCLNIIENSDVVGIATSGGSDSMCLLHFASKNFGKQIVAINIDHSIRTNSRDDSNFVSEYCKQNGIKLYAFSVDAPKFAKDNSLSIEAAARKLRYDIFAKLINEKTVTKIFTAHHQKDRAETMLMSLIYGSGTSGVSAKMQGFENIFRPLLDTPKSEIDRYIQNHQVPFVIDQTNFDNNYSRNKIRNEVLPVLEQINSKSVQNIARFCSHMQKIDDFLRDLAKKYVKKTENLVLVDINIPNELMFYALDLELSSKNLEDICKLKTQEVGKKLLISHFIIQREYKNIAVYRAQTHSEMCKFEDKFCFLSYQITCHKMRKLDFSNKRNLYIDKAKIPENAVVRCIQKGDFIQTFSGYKKLLCDFLQDKKIPQRLRNTLPVLAEDNEVLIIFGVEISKKLKVDNHTRKDDIRKIKFTLSQTK